MGTYITALRQAQESTGTYQTQKPAEKGESQVTKEMFLKLLVAQIRNQDPLKPQDGVEFLSQLAQFTNLEQMMAIREELEGIHADILPPDSTGETESGEGT
jgi:flagellar basal-body rod modification protein FlgD